MVFVIRYQSGPTVSSSASKSDGWLPGVFTLIKNQITPAQNMLAEISSCVFKFLLVSCLTPGEPQCGQAFAMFDICWLHSVQLINDMGWLPLFNEVESVL